MNTEKRSVDFIVEEFRKMGVKKVGSTHCTGKEAENAFEKEYKQNFISIKVGKTIEV